MQAPAHIYLPLILMKTNPDQTEKRLDKDLKTFDRLPSETKRMQALKEDAEKSIGEDKAEVHEEIQEKADQSKK